MIVILNGTPRSGKTSIAKEIQRTFDGVWVNLGVDQSMAATPERYRPGIGLRPGGERPDLEPTVLALYRALFQSVVAHAHEDLNVAVDVGLHSDYRTEIDPFAEAMRIIGVLPKILVGVRCPIETMIRRREQTGMPTSLQMLERWDQAVHSGRKYDLEVDTSLLSTAEAARSIHLLLASMQLSP